MDKAKEGDNNHAEIEVLKYRVDAIEKLFGKIEGKIDKQSEQLVDIEKSIVNLKTTSSIRGGISGSFVSAIIVAIVSGFKSLF